ncbi:MAG: FAD-binding oxidoreductase [Chloroflexi bacterium]|nr:FAD-binding oxidoreductase [Chloroflexota bacterium]MBV9545674.1 FAD-binding oxidoreductase [Chloroflexota bacterium]
MIDKRPAIIARCSGVADIVEAVNFAREHELDIAIRGGSHSAAGLALCDDGLVIDLTRMRGARVDPVARTVQAQAGMLWADLDRETQVYGLATTGGTVSNTGISGLTLGGGLGWLMGKHALACDNLLSVDLVTAEGKVLTASETEHPDLFWALRGGGGNFGVATSFTFRLHEVGPTVLGGMVIHPLAAAKSVLEFYSEFCSNLPDEAEAFAAILTSPDGHKVIALLLAYNGSLDEGERVLRPAREFGSPLADTVAPVQYVQRQQMIDDLGIHGIHRYWKSGFLQQMSDEFVNLVVERAQTISSPMSTIGFFYVHGAASRVAPGATAFGLRAAQWDFDIISQWANAAEAAVHVQWTREFWKETEPFVSGVYVNHIAEDEPGRITAAYGPNYARLVAVKNQYDPSNLFHINHNIRPRALT